MCEDQGMAIVPWAALGGGQLVTKQQREEAEKDQTKRQAKSQTPADVRVSEVLEEIAEKRKTTLQSIVSDEFLRAPKE